MEAEMIPHRTSYSFPFTIASLRERTTVVRAGRADPSDPRSEIVIERESLGYYVTLEPGLLSLHLGTEAPPDWTAGKRLRLTLTLED
jgi:hypothetical protein